MCVSVDGIWEIYYANRTVVPNKQPCEKMKWINVRACVCLVAVCHDELCLPFVNGTTFPAVQHQMAHRWFGRFFSHYLPWLMLLEEKQTHWIKESLCCFGRRFFAFHVPEQIEWKKLSFRETSSVKNKDSGENQEFTSDKSLLMSFAQIQPERKNDSRTKMDGGTVY